MSPTETPTQPPSTRPRRPITPDGKQDAQRKSSSPHDQAPHQARPGEDQSTDEQAHDNHGGHDDQDWGEIKRPKKGSLAVVAIVVVALLAIVFLIGFIPRRTENKNNRQLSDDELKGPISVNVAQATRAPPVIEISVPGSLRPWQEVSVYARTGGYLKKWYADISNQVKAGQLLAEIDSPTVDADLEGAKASLLEARANLEKAKSDAQLQKVTLQRYQDLTKSQSITQQQLDQQQSTYDVAVATMHASEATVATDEAAVAKLAQMQSFEKVTAPFAGVITGRPFDTGSLIIADPTIADAKAMYKIAENDVLRVFVNVPQSDALAIEKGMDVKVLARQRPGHVFIGKVMGTTNYLDATTRSLLTEIKVPNDEGLLLPGMYVTANFTLNRIQPPLLIKAPSLVINADGDQVAVVKDGKAHFEKVTLGRDFGSTVEITEGLNGDEQIISNPNERIVEGAEVNAVESKPAGDAPPAQRTASAK